jgi:hypothetical protein
MGVGVGAGPPGPEALKPPGPAGPQGPMHLEVCHARLKLCPGRPLGGAAAAALGLLCALRGRRRKRGRGGGERGALALLERFLALLLEPVLEWGRARGRGIGVGGEGG